MTGVGMGRRQRNLELGISSSSPGPEWWADWGDRALNYEGRMNDSTGRSLGGQECGMEAHTQSTPLAF